MRVLSLFDGLSAARVAITNLGKSCSEYFASEVDKYAIKIAKKNNTNLALTCLGDVRLIQGNNLPCVDLVIGGSPCQDLSTAKKNREGLKGSKSVLFFEFERLLYATKPTYFLLENVASMSEHDKDTITSRLGVKPIMLNSLDFLPQNRRRLYWTNIKVGQHLKRKTHLVDYLDKVVEKKYFATTEFLNKPKVQKALNNYTKDYAPCITEALARNGSSGEYIANVSAVYHAIKQLRKLTPLECERLQGLPEGYTEGVSDYRRYKMLGSSFTVDVIEHLLKEV